MKNPIIVDNVSPKPIPKVKLRVKLKDLYTRYLFMKLDEQLALALVHSGYEPVVLKEQIIFKYKGPEHKFRMWINQRKIRVISELLVKLEGVI